MAYKKVKVDCLHPYAMQQIRDVLSGNPTTKGYGGKYPDVEGFSDVALNQIKDTVGSALSLDVNAGYEMVFYAVTGIDPTDPTDMNKASVTYLGKNDFKETTTITVDQTTATKMYTLEELSGESFFMSVIGILLKDVPADVWEQFTTGTECTVAECSELLKNYMVRTPVPAVCENGANGFYSGMRFKISGTWDDDNSPLVTRTYTDGAEYGFTIGNINIVQARFDFVRPYVADRFTTKPDIMRILFDTPSNREGYGYSTTFIDMPYVEPVSPAVE